MAERIEVKVTIGEKQVTLAGPEDFVKSEVQRLTNILAANERQSTAPEAVASERELIALKKPSNHAEMVTVLGYVLTESGQQEFTASEMRRAYARAGARPPKVMDQALRDAKNINDYLESGAARGTFRLTAHGRRTVEFDLPKKVARRDR